jgi:hypothetical protein
MAVINEATRSICFLIFAPRLKNQIFGSRTYLKIEEKLSITSNRLRLISSSIIIGILWALEHSCLSHFDNTIYPSKEKWEKIISTSLVVIQWDPERDIHLNKQDYRTIQIGLTPLAAKL